MKRLARTLVVGLSLLSLGSALAGGIYAFQPFTPTRGYWVDEVKVVELSDTGDRLKPQSVKVALYGDLIVGAVEGEGQQIVGITHLLLDPLRDKQIVGFTDTAGHDHRIVDRDGKVQDSKGTVVEKFEVKFEK